MQSPESMNTAFIHHCQKKSSKWRATFMFHVLQQYPFWSVKTPWSGKQVYKVISNTRLWAQVAFAAFAALPLKKTCTLHPSSPQAPQDPIVANAVQGAPKTNQHRGMPGELHGSEGIGGASQCSVWESLMWFSCSTMVHGLINYENCRVCQSVHSKIKLITVMTSMLQCVCLRNKHSKCVV